MKLNLGKKHQSLHQFIDQFPFYKRNTKHLLQSVIDFIIWLDKKHLAGFVSEFSEWKIDEKQRIALGENGLIRPITNFNTLEKTLKYPIEFVLQPKNKGLFDEFRHKKMVFSANLCAPELSIEHHDYRADIFSIGLLLAAFFSNCNPYNSEEYNCLLNKDFNLFRWSDARIKALTKKCLALNLNGRPSLGQIVIALNNIFLDFNQNEENNKSTYQMVMQAYKSSLLDFSARNPLFNFSETNNVISVPTTLNDFLQKGYGWTYSLKNNEKDFTKLQLIKRRQNLDNREKGEDNLYLISYFLYWKNTDFTIKTPLFLHEVNYDVHKDFSWHYAVKASSSEIIINEVLKIYFQDNFNISMPSAIPMGELSIKEFLQNINIALLAKGANEFSFKEELFLGNFAHRNVSIASNYDVLKSVKPNPINLQLLGFENNIQNDINNIDFSDISRFEKHWVLPTDPSQEECLYTAEHSSMVIEGPPGTGKSQTIANVIAQSLANGEKVLFVSEKRAALDVVYKRLDQAGLGSIALLAHDARKDKALIIRSLEHSFITLSEPLMRDSKLGKKLSTWQIEETFNTLRNYYKKVRNKTYKFSLNELFLLSQDMAEEIPEEIIPDLADWLDQKDIIITLFQKQTYKTWKENPLAKFDAHSFSIEQNAEQTFALKLQKCLEICTTLNVIIHRLAYLAHSTIGDILQINSLAKSLKWLLERNLLRLVLEENALRKKYEKLKDQYLSKKSLLNKRKSNNPSYNFDSIDLRSLESALLFSEKEPENLTLKEFMQIHFDLADEWFADDTKTILKSAIRDYKNQEQLIALQSKFISEFKTQNVDDFIEQVSLLQDLTQRTSYQIPDFFNFLEQKRNPDSILIQFLHIAESLSILEENAFPLHTNFRNLDIIEFVAWLTKLKAIHFSSNEIDQLKIFNQLKPNIKFCLLNADYTPSILEKASINREIKRAFIANPDLEKFTSIHLQKILTEISTKYGDWLKWNIWKILDKYAIQFQENSLVSSIPAGKLSSLEKQEKWCFKRGIRLLKHEFSKEKQLKSLRELLNSDAEFIIDILKPVKLMSPSAVAEVFACKENMFDLVIFDEASQIRLEEVIPICHRAQRVVVVGDSEQLPPSSFFRNQGIIASTVDNLQYSSFLHAAKNAFPSKQLKWHYRSKNEDLINFSNAAFYKNQLRVFPYFQNTTRPAIEFQFVQNGLYNNRQNIIEAKALVAHLAKELKTNKGLTYAIITMSEVQQICVEKEIENLRQLDSLFNNLIENEENRYTNSTFEGLLVKNLENIQGEERDVVLISVGYGFNKDGKFLHNFGAIMQGGGSNRLNVLLTRAKEKMIVFCSFNPDKIRNSNNDGIWTLKQFLIYAIAVENKDFNAKKTVLNSLNRGQIIREIHTETKDTTIQNLVRLFSKSFKSNQFLKPLNFGMTHINYFYQLFNDGAASNIVYEFESEGENIWEEYFIAKQIIQNRNFHVLKISSQEIGRVFKKIGNTST